MSFSLPGHGARHGHGTSGGRSKVTPVITVHGHALTVSQLPAHNHGGATGAENHGMIYYDMMKDRATPNVFTNVQQSGRWFNTRSYSGQSQFQHSHPISYEGANQAHAHTATAAEIDTEPPFHALVYIMKT